jgi:pimeloyl-ACP methyl ester carboxylesterase
MKQLFKMRIYSVLGSLILSCILLYLLGIGYIYFYQERFVFFPSRLNQDYPFQFRSDFIENTIELSSRAKINYLVFNSKSAKGVILYFHGNAGSLKDWGWVAAEIAQKTGWCVWIMDFPGYGKSSGPLPKNEKVLLEMGNVMRAQILKERPDLPLVLYGRSIGSGIAAALAVEKPVSGLILETPYRSLAKLGHEIYPFFPESISRFDFDNERSLKSLDSTPVLIFHGSNDRIIPQEHGKLLSEIAGQSQFISIANGDHNNLSDFPEYWSALINFLEPLSGEDYKEISRNSRVNS